MLSEDEEDCSSGDDTLYSNSKDSVSSSQAQEMSKISDVGESVLLDNETEEGLLSSELENELKAREESYSSDGFEDDNGGFFFEEAEDDNVHQAHKRYRKSMSDSDSSSEVGKVKAKKRAYITYSSSEDEKAVSSKQGTSILILSDEFDSQSKIAECSYDNDQVGVLCTL